VIRAARLTVLLVAAAAPAYAAPALPPVDHAARVPDFFTFRARLQVALATRDTAAVLAAVDPSIRNSFGGDDGAGDFRTRWKLGDPASPFWEEMATVLALGGTFHDESTFVAPYVFAAWPERYDAFEHVAVLGRGVRAREAPSQGGASIASLDFAVVRLAPEAEPSSGDAAGWVSIRLADGRTAWVARALVRSPVDHRAIFSKRGGAWRLVTFVAGD
jgi:hypothetical protein